MKKIGAGQFERFPQIEIKGVKAAVCEGLSSAVSRWKKDCKRENTVITVGG